MVVKGNDGNRWCSPSKFLVDKVHWVFRVLIVPTNFERFLDHLIFFPAAYEIVGRRFDGCFPLGGLDCCKPADPNSDQSTTPANCCNPDINPLEAVEIQSKFHWSLVSAQMLPLLQLLLHPELAQASLSWVVRVKNQFYSEDERSQADHATYQ